MSRLDDEINEILRSLEPLPAAPPGRPRYTAPWQKSGSQVVSELRALAEDPEVGAAVNGCGILAGAGDPLLTAGLDRLLSMASERAPTALHCLGEIGLTDYLLSQIMAQTHFRVGQIEQGVALLNGMSKRLRFAHFLDNPARLNADGSATTARGMTRQQYLELADFTASQRPEGKRGRPGKSHAPRGKPRPRISIEAIRDTEALRVAEWAAKHAPDLDLGDKRQAKAAFARYDRAAYHRRIREP
jgi:hypothetical protein